MKDVGMVLLVKIKGEKEWLMVGGEHDGRRRIKEIKNKEKIFFLNGK